MDHCPDISALSSYVDGELNEEDSGKVKSHVASCASCAERIKAIRAGEQLLVRSLRDSMASMTNSREGDCISPELMTSYFHDLLSPEERAQVERHLDLCDACLSELNSLARAEAQLRQSKTEPLPDRLRQQVEGLWKREERSGAQIIRLAVRLAKGGIELVRESLFPEAVSFQEVFAPVGAYRNVESKDSVPTGLLLKRTLPGIQLSLFVQWQTDNQARLEVRVEDEKLRPVAAQRVLVRCEQALLVSERTGDDGKVVIANLEPGAYQLGINIMGKEHNVDLGITRA